ncbi:MAG: aldo/keto reductase [Planctomycetota bacterium]
MSESIILGLWPIAGITTIGVTAEDAKGTIAAAIDCGVRRFDTAFSYGFDGESDRLIGSFLQKDRDDFELIGKVGQRWDSNRSRIVDGSPERLMGDAEESLRRSKLEHFDLMMLHGVDPDVPVTESAAAMLSMIKRGLAKRVGLCNATEAQRQEFASVVVCDAIQCPLNLLQQETLANVIAPANNAGTKSHVYWTLMKGLLAGKITRDHEFAEGDSRPSYPVFQGEQRENAHRIVDGLAEIASAEGKTVAQLSIGWVQSQPGVDAALVGARRPEQAKELAGAEKLHDRVVNKINDLL